MCFRNEILYDIKHALMLNDNTLFSILRLRFSYVTFVNICLKFSI